MLEVLIASLILALTVWAAQFLYVGLLRGTRQSEKRLEALAVSETVYVQWSNKVRELWSLDPAGLDTPMTMNDTFLDHIYRVEISPRIDNPGHDPADPSSPAKLEMRPLKVVVTYNEGNLTKEIRVNGVVAR